MDDRKGWQLDLVVTADLNPNACTTRVHVCTRIVPGKGVKPIVLPQVMDIE